MSRRPGKDMPQSNGHGRSGVPGRETAQIGNLFIQSSEGKSYQDLKQQLIKMCQEENLRYGILVKSLVSDGRSPIGMPVLTYKVYVADGREELIRVPQPRAFRFVHCANRSGGQRCICSESPCGQQRTADARQALLLLPYCSRKSS
jgi:hypothetical protein